MFKINNKNTRTTSMKPFLIHSFFNVFVAVFEQVNITWVMIQPKQKLTQNLNFNHHTNFPYNARCVLKLQKYPNKLQFQGQ